MSFEFVEIAVVMQFCHFYFLYTALSQYQEMFFFCLLLSHYAYISHVWYQFKVSHIWALKFVKSCLNTLIFSVPASFFAYSRNIYKIKIELINQKSPKHDLMVLFVRLVWAMTRGQKKLVLSFLRIQLTCSTFNFIISRHVTITVEWLILNSTTSIVVVISLFRYLVTHYLFLILAIAWLIFNYPLWSTIEKLYENGK